MIDLAALRAVKPCLIHAGRGVSTINEAGAGCDQCLLGVAKAAMEQAAKIADDFAEGGEMTYRYALCKNIATSIREAAAEGDSTVSSSERRDT